MIMYVVTIILFLGIFANYFLGAKLFKLPKDERYFSNVNNYNTINKRDIMSSPKYITVLSIFTGLFIGMYLFLGKLQDINGSLKIFTIVVILILYLMEITQKVSITEDNLEYERAFWKTKKIPLNQIDGMYIYSFNKKFMNKRALTTKLVVTTGNKHHKLLVSGIDIKALLSMMKDNFGIEDHKMYVGDNKKIN